eukprot:6637520-Lingulodinium_polyedra.AAC.1
MTTPAKPPFAPLFESRVRPSSAQGCGSRSADCWASRHCSRVPRSGDSQQLFSPRCHWNLSPARSTRTTWARFGPGLRAGVRQE